MKILKIKSKQPFHTLVLSDEFNTEKKRLEGYLVSSPSIEQYFFVSNVGRKIWDAIEMETGHRITSANTRKDAEEFAVNKILEYGSRKMKTQIEIVKRQHAHYMPVNEFEK